MILTFGEILLRLSPQLGGEWIKQCQIPTYVGGAELNVAFALAQWDMPVSYCSAMPDHSMSDEIKEFLSEKNIGVDRMITLGERIGIYFLPQGADLKNAGVIYDRANSSFSHLKKENMNWDRLFEGVTWFHLSAISPALNQNIAFLCVEAAKQAQERGIKVSFDLNFRSKLWKYGKSPLEIIPEIIQYCDVVMGNIWAANTLLGIALPDGMENFSKDDYLLQSEKTAQDIIKNYPNVKWVAHTFRFDTELGGVNYYATLYNDGQQYVSRDFKTDSVVDKVGSGDCFMAGLIYGIFKSEDAVSIVNFAAAAAFGKLQEKGDATQQTVQEIKTKM